MLQTVAPLFRRAEKFKLNTLPGYGEKKNDVGKIYYKAYEMIRCVKKYYLLASSYKNPH